MSAVQWSGMEVLPSDGQSVYLVLLVGTSIGSYSSPDQCGPVSVGLWMASSAMEAMEEATRLVSYDNELNAPALVAIKIDGVAK